jgi:hypothetical protein
MYVQLYNHFGTVTGAVQQRYQVQGTRYLYNTTAQIDSSKTVKTYLQSFDTAGVQEYVLDCVQ